MKNYIVQDGCHNCKKVFKRYDYEQLNEYFCTINAPLRPLCMSVAMDESPDYDRDSEFDNIYYKWDKWKENREVRSWGKCDLWEKSKVK